ncbi:MAG: hypothetical protein Q8908_11370 [Bacteroidota bacterium]|nr:hypothetical protein [Bacteroidota bacterium]
MHDYTWTKNVTATPRTSLRACPAIPKRREYNLMIGSINIILSGN